MATKLSWYGVKTLYRSQATGPRRGTDRLYASNVTVVEERVILVRARSAREAIRKAEAEAKTYAADSHRNPYGQRVRTRFLGVVDAYDMNEPLREQAEVFSTNEVVPRRVSDQAIIARQLGRAESARVFASRRNVLDISFVAAARGVVRTPREQSYFERLQHRLGRRDA